jgi:hypothetical protein
MWKDRFEVAGVWEEECKLQCEEGKEDEWDCVPTVELIVCQHWN